MTPAEMRYAAETLEQVNDVLRERGYSLENSLDWFRLRDEDGTSIPIGLDSSGLLTVEVY